MYNIEPVDDGGWSVDSDMLHGSVEGGGKIFMRRAKSMVSDAESMWLVAEMNGVRCYLEQGADGRIGFFMTTRDIYPAV